MPAAASTSASKSPASSFRSRVSTLPRMPANRACGRTLRNCAARRTLPVPTTASPSSRRRAAAKSSRPACARRTMASRGSSRGRTAPMSSPSGSTADMSFALCTAMSTSSARRASSISLTNRRLPPTSDSGACCSRSPAVRMTTTSAAAPAASIRAATVLACQSASALPRVPILSVVIRRSRPPVCLSIVPPCPLRLTPYRFPAG